MNIFNEGIKDPRVRRYIMPKKIIWQSPGVINTKELLREKDGWATLSSNDVCTIPSGEGVLLDFGCELSGGVQIMLQSCGSKKSGTIRVRFGESAMEAMSDIGFKNATNNHAVRDSVIDVSSMGCTEVGTTGFRFVRVDCAQEEAIQIKSIKAVFIYRELSYKGSFSCSDERLSTIWMIGAYTVHLNMQDYLWDGVKRDRLVWIGDMHPEVSTIKAVFGYDECVPKSLDFMREETPPDGWMNGLPSYSMWWIIIHYDWYMQNGDRAYLTHQKDYLKILLESMLSYIEKDGDCTIKARFIDWHTNDKPAAQSAGFLAVFKMALDRGRKLCNVLGLDALAKECGEREGWLSQEMPEGDGHKHAAALLALSGVLGAEEANEKCLKISPAQGISTFLGYYVLKARGEAGDMDGCLSLIKEFWGAMVKLGATTFWEDFDISWIKNAARIDELTPEKMTDIHGDNGKYCYEGYRHSLCHGWASGPTAFLSEYVLGVRVLEPGCKRVSIKPNLGTLSWAKGTYPTPLGEIEISHEKVAQGRVKTTVKAPKGVEICED